MKPLSTKQVIILTLVAVAIGVGIFLLVTWDDGIDAPDEVIDSEDEEEVMLRHEVIGTSVEGRDIEAFNYGDGDTHILFVGGIHGGYEWNSVVLAYEFIDYLDENPDFIPDNVMVTIIPSANPDGVYEIVGTEGRFSSSEVPGGDHSAGRFNANGVDLNRNFDCKWQPTSTWRGQTVDAGSSAFSEPEAQVIRDFVMEHSPDAAVFWHSQANTVYASECEEGILSETLDIMEVYADAADYNTAESFDAYEITGDVEGWLASLGIPALSVELETHETVEWERNLEGVGALLEYYSQGQ